MDSADTKSIMNVNSSNNRVMLIDGTSIMYRSYYKLLGTDTNSTANILTLLFVGHASMYFSCTFISLHEHKFPLITARVYEYVNKLFASLFMKI